MKADAKGVVLPALCLLSACGATWVDNSTNFERIFGISKPQDVEVLHSYYWKSSHWTTEYSYFIALRASPQFKDGLTSAKVMRETAPNRAALNSCGDQHPSWFLPKSITAYQEWAPKGDGNYRVFRDRTEGTLYLCDSRL